MILSSGVEKSALLELFNCRLQNVENPCGIHISTWRFRCSPFLVMTCFLIRGDNIRPKKELHRSLQVLAQDT